MRHGIVPRPAKLAASPRKRGNTTCPGLYLGEQNLWHAIGGKDPPVLRPEPGGQDRAAGRKERHVRALLTSFSLGGAEGLR